MTGSRAVISGWERDAKGRVLHVMDGHSGMVEMGALPRGERSSIDHKRRGGASAGAPQLPAERLPFGQAVLVWGSLSLLLWLVIWRAGDLLWRWVA